MKCQIPQIAWHEREPVLSIDFQPLKGNRFRLASGGSDKLVLIWYVTFHDEKGINIEFHSEYDRHLKPVNVVRFSPSGNLLASGDDDGELILWKLKEHENDDDEKWIPYKLLSGRSKDIFDISWSADGNYLISASTENKAVMWDMQTFQVLHVFSDSKGYVQGVSWDPLNKYMASLGTDRSLRIMSIKSKRTVYTIRNAPRPVGTDKSTPRVRLFHDDTLKSYFRRLSFTPDGELLIVPSGILPKDEKSGYTTYIFSRHSLTEPVAHLPSGDKYTVAVRCNPLLYKLRGSENKENCKSKPLINLPYRMMFAVAACDSVLIYDTEQLVPLASISNIHYTHLTDLSWSADGRILVASSTDGYCSFITFSEEELGEIYVPPPPEPLKIEEPVIGLHQLNSYTQNICKPDDGSLKPNSIKSDHALAKSQTGLEGNDTSMKNCDGVKSNNISSPKPNAVTKSDDQDASNACSKPEDGSVKPNAKEAIAVTPNMPDNKCIISPKGISSVLIKPKKPKLTIESFFKSPKTNLETKSQPSKDDSALSASKNTSLIDDETEFKEPNLKSTPIGKNVNIHKDVPSLDNDSIEVIFETKVLPKEPKCKVQLDFANKINNDGSTKKASDPDLSDIIAVDSFQDSTEKVSSIKTEDDWKLELSQDESIAPMDTSEPSTSTLKVVDKPVEVETTPKPVNKLIETEITPKPKRRVNFITLSKTVSSTPPKM